MPEYRGNAIYDYVTAHHLDYYFSAGDHWALVYGNSESIPKVLAFARKVRHLREDIPEEEKQHVLRAMGIAKFLRLPFLYVRFMPGGNQVSVWRTGDRVWRTVSYDRLRDLFEEYGVVQPGTARKPVNQYTSSPYHDWQRENLGPITVSDFDLLKYKNGEIAEILELKRSKIPLDQWSPYPNDFPNFALLLNAIVHAGKRTPFTLYYNVMQNGPVGNRQEDISQIKVFDFVIPGSMINAAQVQPCCRGTFRLENLLE